MLTPLYTNYLTVKEVGDITYLFSIIAFLNIIFSFGLDSAFFRFFKNDDTEHNKKVFTHAYIGIASLSLLFTTIIIIFSKPVSGSLIDMKDGYMLIILGALIPFFDALMTIPYSLLRMTRKARRFSLTRFVLIIVAVGLNVLFIVFFNWGPKGAFLAQVLANLAGVFIFFPEIIKNIKFKFDRSLLGDMLRFGIPTVPAMISGMILQVADRPILKILTTSHEVGMYSVNYRLGIPMMLLVAVFEYAWKPFYLSRYHDTDAKQLFARILTYFTVVCGLFFLITALFMEFIVRIPFIGGRFINPVYWSGMGIIPIILAGYYFNGVFNNFAAGFHIEKKTKYLPYAVGAGALTNIVLNFITIPIYGLWGAAWAVFFAYLVAAVTLYVFTRRIYVVKYEWLRLAKIWVLTTLIYFATNYFNRGFSLKWKFLIDFAALIFFSILLFVFNVFTKGEIARIKGILKLQK